MNVLITKKIMAIHKMTRGILDKMTPHNSRIKKKKKKKSKKIFI